jgi:hypothetical protein
MRNLREWGLVVATSGEMVSAVAEVMGVPVSKVETLDRRLSENGLRTKGGRGRAAAHMSALDVTNLVFAVMSGAGMTEAPAATEKMTNLKRSLASTNLKLASDGMGGFIEGAGWRFSEPSELELFPAGLALASAETFGETVAAMLDAMASDEVKLSDDVVVTLKFTTDGPDASLTLKVREDHLRVRFLTSRDERETPVVKQELTLDGSVLQRLSHLITPIT